MARVSRLAAYGVTGRFFGVIVAATGSITATSNFTGSAGAGSADGSIASSVAITGVGAPIAAGTGTILGRGLFDSGVGASVRAATGSIAATFQMVGLSTSRVGRLSPYGVSGRFFPTPNKTAVTQRNWTVIETFGLNIGITDFGERVFQIVDTFGLNLSPTAYFGATAGLMQSVTTLTGVSATISAAVGAITATADFGGAGANVIVNSGDGSIAAVATFGGQGATAGTVFSTGVGSMSASSALAGVGSSNVAALGEIVSSTQLLGVAGPIFAAVGSIAATGTFNGSSITPVAGVGLIPASVTFSGVSAAIADAVGEIAVTVTFRGDVPPELAPNVVTPIWRSTVFRRVDRSVNVRRRARK